MTDYKNIHDIILECVRECLEFEQNRYDHESTLDIDESTGNIWYTPTESSVKRCYSDIEDEIDKWDINIYCSQFVDSFLANNDRFLCEVKLIFKNELKGLTR